jgi:hypothetical protein
MARNHYLDCDTDGQKRMPQNQQLVTWGGPRRPVNCLWAHAVTPWTPMDMHTYRFTLTTLTLA